MSAEWDVGSSGGASTTDDSDDDSGSMTSSTTSGVIRTNISISSSTDEEEEKVEELNTDGATITTGEPESGGTDVDMDDDGGSDRLSSDRDLFDTAEKEAEKNQAEQADRDLYDAAEEVDSDGIDAEEDSFSDVVDEYSGWLGDTADGASDTWDEATSTDSRLEGADHATTEATDWALDNDEFSVQDRTRGNIAYMAGFEDDEELAEWAHEQDEGLTESIDETVEGTAFDNPVTDAARKGSDMIFGDFARSVIGAGTGIDTETGGTDAETGALEAFDIGVTAATAGTGKVAASGAKTVAKSDDAAGVFGRLVGRTGDNAARAGDDAASGGDDLLPAVPDDTPGSSRWGSRVGDDAASAANDAGRSIVDDLGEGLSNLRSDMGRLFARTNDDAARVSDDAARASDDTARVADDVARGSDDAGPIGRFLSSRTAKAGAGVGAVLGGGALLENMGAFDDLSVTDGDGNTWALTAQDQFEPTEEHPEGGVLFRVDQGPADAGAYTVMVGQTGRNVVILDADGNRIPAKIDVQEFAEAAERGEGAL